MHCASQYDDFGIVTAAAIKRSFFLLRLISFTFHEFHNKTYFSLIRLILFFDGWWGFSFHRHHNNRLVERSAVNVCSTKSVSLAHTENKAFAFACNALFAFAYTHSTRISWRFVLISLQQKSIWNRLAHKYMDALYAFFYVDFFPFILRFDFIVTQICVQQ